MSGRIKLRCPACGSGNISSDATAHWDLEAQAWVLASTQDHETCDDCGAGGNFFATRAPYGREAA